MTTNKVYQTPETSLVFTETGGDATFTPKNEANNKGRVSSQLDRGTGAKARRYQWEAQFKVQATPSIGSVIRVYLYSSMTSAAADQSSDAELSAETSLGNFVCVGQVVITAASTSVPFYASGTVFVPGRYIVVAMWNASGQSLTNVNGDNKITLTPLPDDIQAAA